MSYPSCKYIENIIYWHGRRVHFHFPIVQLKMACLKSHFGAFFKVINSSYLRLLCLGLLPEELQNLKFCSSSGATVWSASDLGRSV